MSTRTPDYFPFDIGANHLVLLYTDMMAYCRELGIPFEPFTFVNYRLFKNGKLIPVFDALSRWEKIKLALAHWKNRNVPPSFLESSSLIEYDNANGFDTALKEVGPAYANDIVDTYVGVYQFHRATEISRAGLLSQMNSIKNFTSDWYLHRTPGGMITLPQAFADTVETHVSTPVSGVTAHDSGVTVEVNGEKKEYDAVVIGTTATISKQIYQNPTQKQTDVMNVAKYAPSIIAAFKIPDDAFGDPTKKDTLSAVWFPYSESKILSSYSNEAEKGPELRKDGKTILLAFFREEGANMYLSKSDEEIYAAAEAEVRRACPYLEGKEMEPYDLYRWQEAMPKFYEGSLRKVETFLQDGQGEQNVWFVGDYLNAPWAEGATRIGKKVAGQLGKSLQ